MLFAIISVAVCVPADLTTQPPVAILSQENENNFDGSFTNNYEAGNGISFAQEGIVKIVPDIEAPVHEVSGSYSYVAPDGTEVKVDYIANENGFQPQGDVLPVAPPLPPVIARALQYIADHPPKKEDEE